MKIKTIKIRQMIGMFMIVILITSIQIQAHDPVNCTHVGHPECPYFPEYDKNKCKWQGNDHQYAGVGIYSYLISGNVTCILSFMSHNGLAGAFIPLKPELKYDTKGSWNMAPLNWLCNYFLYVHNQGGDSKGKDRFIKYAKNCLNPDPGDGPPFGLWGKEIFSWKYWDPLPAAAVAYMEFPTLELRRLLQAHVGALAILSTGSRVYTPSCRSQNPSTADLASKGQDYFLKLALGLNPPFPVGRRNIANWAYFIAENVTHNYMSTDLQKEFKKCFQYGTNIDWVVAKLNALNVTTRGTVTVWRYKNGNYGVMLSNNSFNPKPTQVPYYAVSKVGNNILLLGGHRSTWSPNECIRTFENGIPYFMTSEAKIRAPTGTLIYKVVFDQNGVRREYTE